MKADYLKKEEKNSLVIINHNLINVIRISEFLDSININYKVVEDNSNDTELSILIQDLIFRNDNELLKLWNVILENNGSLLRYSADSKECTPYLDSVSFRKDYLILNRRIHSYDSILIRDNKIYLSHFYLDSYDDDRIINIRLTDDTIILNNGKSVYINLKDIKVDQISKYLAKRFGFYVTLFRSGALSVNPEIENYIREKIKEILKR